MMLTPINPSTLSQQGPENLEPEVANLAKLANNPILAEKIRAIGRQLHEDKNASIAVNNLSQIFGNRITDDDDLRKNPTFQKSYCVFLKKHGHMLTQNPEDILTLKANRTDLKISRLLLSLQTDSYAQFLSEGFITDTVHIPNYESFEEKYWDEYCQCLEKVSSEGRITSENVRGLLKLAKNDGTAWLIEDCIKYIEDNLLNSKNAFQLLKESIANRYQGLCIACLALLAEKYVPKERSNQKMRPYLARLSSLIDFTRPFQSEITALSESANYGILDFIFDPYRQQEKNNFGRMVISERGLEVAVFHIDNEEPPENKVKRQESLKKIILNGIDAGNRIPLHFKPLRGFTDIRFIKDLLERNSALTSLDLSHTILGPEEAWVIAEALRKNTTLKFLNLYGCKIGPLGARKIAEALRENQALETLNLGANLLTQRSVQDIMEALALNQTLRSLSLKENPIRNEGAFTISALLSKNKTLTSLNLRNCSISKEGTKAIAEALKINRSMKAISLASNLMDHEGVQAFFDMLMVNSTLTHINLNTYRWWADVPLPLGRKNTSLKHLGVCESPISDGNLAVAKMLNKHFEVESISVSHTKIPLQVMDELLKNPFLKSLTIADSHICPAAFVVLLHALNTNSSITSLSLKGSEGEWRNGWEIYIMNTLLYNTNLIRFSTPDQQVPSEDIAKLLERNIKFLKLPKKVEWEFINSFGRYNFDIFDGDFWPMASCGSLE